MSSSGESRVESQQRPLLRLFEPADAPELSESLRVDGKLSPSMRLREFFCQWFAPIVLRRASPGNVRMFLESLDWWERLTADPPLIEIQEKTLADFAGRLEAATYRRGRLGKERRLSPKTVENHLTRIDRLLTRAGPKLGKNRPGARLLDDPPAIQIDKAEIDTRPPFELDQVHAVFAEVCSMQRPASLELSAVDWWNGALAAFLYTGWRRRTVFSLRWTMLAMGEGPWWIEAPASIVPKTKKSSRRIVHPVLREALLRIRPASASGLIFPHRHNVRTLHDWHVALQRRAGIAEEATLGWNGWRRTHARLMTAVGYDQAVDLSRAALDHSSAKITKDHYYDPVNDFIPRLPAVELAGGGQRQLTLF